jgi:hypothetical protein
MQIECFYYNGKLIGNLYFPMNFSVATRGRCGGDRMTFGFTTIYAIGANHY